MATVLTESNSRIRLTKALQRDRRLSTKARDLQGLLVRVFGKDTSIELDVEPHEAENSLTIRIGEPGRAQCTRSIVESLLKNIPWLETVLLEMKGISERVGTWLSDVDKLFQQIRTWIKKGGPYEVEEAPIKVQEVFPKEYLAKKLIVRRGKRAVEVVPRGTWWVTTEGRVDLVGSEQEHALILSHREGGWLWVEEAADVKLRPLTADLFIKLLEDCMG